MSGVANLRFFWRLLGLRLSGRFRPLTAIFNVTSRCNSRCTYCYADYHRRNLPDPPREEIKRRLDLLHHSGTLRVSLSGGEPLLREDIGEIISHVKRRKMICALNSNGYLVPDRIDMLRPLDHLVLSLDGDEAAHDRNREPGSFPKVMAAYHAARRHGLGISTSTILTRHNLGSIDFVLALARRHGTWAHFNLVVEKLDSVTPAGLKAETESYRDALRHLIRRKREGYPVRFSVKAMELALRWEDYRAEARGVDPRYPRCSAGKWRVMVDADGRAYPCELLLGKEPCLDLAREVPLEHFSRLAGHSCQCCFLLQQIEFNLLYEMDWSVLWNYLTIAWKRSPDASPPD